MFRFLAVICFLFCAGFVFAHSSSATLNQITKSFSVNNTPANILEEEDDIKKLVLKYASAPETQKQTIKQEIIKLQTKKQEEAFSRQEKRIERQENKVKQLKEELKQNRKEKDKIVQKKVSFLLEEENIQKIKEESLSKKIKDKAKDIK